MRPPPPDEAARPEGAGSGKRELRKSTELQTRASTSLASRSTPRPAHNHKRTRFNPPAVEHENDDACGECGEGGTLLCCDGCYASVHAECAAESERQSAAAGEASNEWFCAWCVLRRSKGFRERVRKEDPCPLCGGGGREEAGRAWKPCRCAGRYAANAGRGAASAAEVTAEGTSQRGILVGPKYQAVVPDYEPSAPRPLLWDPHRLPPEEIDRFLCAARTVGREAHYDFLDGTPADDVASRLGAILRGGVRPRRPPVAEDAALSALHGAGYEADAAVGRLREQAATAPRYTPGRDLSRATEAWSVAEVARFEEALARVGRNFPAVARRVGTKGVPSVVSFYYCVWRRVLRTTKKAVGRAGPRSGRPPPPPRPGAPAAPPPRSEAGRRGGRAGRRGAPGPSASEGAGESDSGTEGARRRAGRRRAGRGRGTRGRGGPPGGPAASAAAPPRRRSAREARPPARLPGPKRVPHSLFRSLSPVHP
eukprot:tig00000147_g9503.t1